MASNDSAESARKAQDVVLPEVHDREKKGTFHWGRGGEGNMATIGKSEPRPQSKPRRKSSGAAARRGSNLLEKGKEKLGLGHDGKKPEGSAIED